MSTSEQALNKQRKKKKVAQDEDVDKVTSDNNSLCVSEIQTSSNNV